ncbi:sulfotransferase family 2 domain-containing protein [Roseovarius sp. EGI FJ00037]|uniref:sulfotransferase family 2 domain-containing protein n=1 Tax=Roseovarius salincola TaxID=2978479 RepID=UPI0022A8103D|nr:sulfotransferase family 2 domain-containing protein [Roseovarius sp. EGI FJ00037]MCZ0814019.1 sulfotransferase family 2 domain-containing protein [Roseovarius sp. EGI FJ00037]
MSVADPLYVFVHLSKTGGTSLFRHMQRHLASEDDLVYLGPLGDAERERLNRPPLEDRPENERQRVRVLIGHRVKMSTLDLVPWREPRLIFVMRDPVKRLISKYNYQMHRQGLSDDPVPFFTWLENLKPHAWDSAFWLCRRFLEMEADALRDVAQRQQIANRLLERFNLVTTTERMDEDMPHVFRQLGIPSEMRRENVKGRDHKVALTPDEDVLERARQVLNPEIGFYNAWAERAPYWGPAGRPSLTDILEG